MQRRHHPPSTSTPHHWRSLLGIFATLFFPNVWALSFVFPPPEIPGDERHRYYWQLLDAALAANRDTYGDYRLEAYGKALTFPRSVAEVESGKGLVNIVSRATNLELERRLLPVRIPLDKGLLGARLFLVMPAGREQLQRISSADELRKLSIGQNVTWTDVRILKAAGFKVVTTESYQAAFTMLGAGRFDLFARGASEIHAEWQTHRQSVPGLSIDDRFLLQYPMPRYFFVPRTPKGRQMAERIEDGLRRMRASGEFERRYQSYKRLALKDLNLAGRIVIRLPNPELSPEAPLDDPYWWDDLSTELNARRPPAASPR